MPLYRVIAAILMLAVFNARAQDSQTPSLADRERIRHRGYVIFYRRRPERYRLSKKLLICETISMLGRKTRQV